MHSVDDYVAKLFELAPGEVALDVDAGENNLLDHLVGGEARLDLIEALIRQRVATQVNGLD